MIAVPNSSGTSTARLKAPAGAADCHLHIYDPRFPMAWPQLRGTHDASVAEYRLLRKRIGTQRAVVVHLGEVELPERQPAKLAEHRVFFDLAVAEPLQEGPEFAFVHEGGE